MIRRSVRSSEEFQTKFGLQRREIIPGVGASIRVPPKRKTELCHQNQGLGLGLRFSAGVSLECGIRSSQIMY